MYLFWWIFVINNSHQNIPTIKWVQVRGCFFFHHAHRPSFIHIYIEYILEYEKRRHVYCRRLVVLCDQSNVCRIVSDTTEWTRIEILFSVIVNKLIPRPNLNIDKVLKSYQNAYPKNGVSLTIQLKHISAVMVYPVWFFLSLLSL